MRIARLTGLVCVLGVAVILAVPGEAQAVSDYFRYAYFTTAHPQYFGGYDVDSYGDFIYVNRNGYTLDEYKVTISDYTLRHQHPDNPDATGPMLPRTLTHERSWSCPTLDSASVGEVYATATHVYWLRQDERGIDKIDLSTGVITNEITTPFLNLAQLARDESDGTWFASSENRDVHSWNGTSWVSEFNWPSLGGGHGDGIEIVGDNFWVSDMTSDFLLMYEKVADGSARGWSWQIYDKNGDLARNASDAFTYTYTADYVEGMGFGAMDHFWANGSGTLYEIGGGEVQQHVDPYIPEPLTIAGMLLGVGSVASYVRRRRRAA